MIIKKSFKMQFKDIYLSVTGSQWDQCSIDNF